jgi:ElaB/YqjD/DUF883 family membrane-anchored ribosome-binding protein
MTADGDKDAKRKRIFAAPEWGGLHSAWRRCDSTSGDGRRFRRLSRIARPFTAGGVMNTELSNSQGLADGKRDTSLAEPKGVVVDAKKALKEAGCSAAEGFSAIRAKVEGRIDAARSRFDDVRLVATQRARDAAGATDNYVKQNPWKTLGIAAATGVVIGILVRGRKSNGAGH